MGQDNNNAFGKKIGSERIGIGRKIKMFLILKKYK